MIPDFLEKRGESPLPHDSCRVVIEILKHKNETRTVTHVSNQNFVDLSKVKPGTYFVVIEMDGVFEVRKVIRKP